MAKLLIRLSGERLEILKWIAIIVIVICICTTPLSTLQCFVWRYIMKEHPADTKLMEDIVNDLPKHAVSTPVVNDATILPSAKGEKNDRID